MSPSRRTSASGVALQQYLLLHSQREALEQELRYGSTSPSRTSAPDIESSQIIDLVDVEEQEEDIVKSAALRRLNNEIKSTLTSLLNCAGVRADERYRDWIQTRLMDTERRLSASRIGQLNERIIL